jgi:hypothetical protein
MFCLALFIPVLSAQSNEIIDTILTEERLTAGSAAYLVLSLADPDAIPDSREAAFAALAQKVDLSPVSAGGVDDQISIGEFSYLLQQSLALPRGIGSRIRPGARYALRDLKFLNIVQGRVYPAMELSGERALRITGRTLNRMEARI